MFAAELVDIPGLWDLDDWTLEEFLFLLVLLSLESFE